MFSKIAVEYGIIKEADDWESPASFRIIPINDTTLTQGNCITYWFEIQAKKEIQFYGNNKGRLD